MIGPTLQSYAERELKYQVRKQVSKEIREHCPKSDPMVSGITVMLGTVLAMATFGVLLSRANQDRRR